MKKFDFKSIKSFEDACADQGKDPNGLPDYSKCAMTEGEEAFNMEVFQLSRIFKSINKDEDGKEWEPAMDDRKYFPWMDIEEDETKRSGLGLSYDGFDFVDSASRVASRLCLRSPDRVRYVFDQFKEKFELMILFHK